MATRIPTRVKAIAQKLDPLVSFYKTNKPTCRSISIFHTDWLFLIKTPLDSLRPQGFNVTKERGLTYGLFTLKPVTPPKIEKSSVLPH